MALKHVLSPSVWMSSVENGKSHSSMHSRMESIGSVHWNDILKLSASKCLRRSSVNSRRMVSYRGRYSQRSLRVSNTLSLHSVKHYFLSSMRWASGEKKQNRKSLLIQGFSIISLSALWELHLALSRYPSLHQDSPWVARESRGSQTVSYQHILQVYLYACHHRYGAIHDP